MRFQSKKEKEENQHHILHVGISLGAKSWLQQTILLFWSKFIPKKDISGQKK